MPAQLGNDRLEQVALEHHDVQTAGARALLARERDRLGSEVVAHTRAPGCSWRGASATVPRPVQRSTTTWARRCRPPRSAASTSDLRLRARHEHAGTDPQDHVTEPLLPREVLQRRPGASSAERATVRFRFRHSRLSRLAMTPARSVPSTLCISVRRWPQGTPTPCRRRYSAPRRTTSVGSMAQPLLPAPSPAPYPVVGLELRTRARPRAVPQRKRRARARRSGRRRAGAT